MKIEKLGIDVDIHAIGTSITQWGVIYQGNGRIYLAPFPDQDETELIELPTSVLRMGVGDWERFLNQSDVLDVVGPDKAILRKSQRHIDRQVQWEVFRRDAYRCRYCWREAPLTVDHVVLWENGGASVVSNLLAVCGPHNKLRGNMEYDVWIASDKYRKVSVSLPPEVKARNQRVVSELDQLRQMTAKTRAR